MLGVEQDDIKECCYRIICLYQRSKPIQDELEREVAALKKARDDKRNAARGNNAAVAVDSPASQPSSPVRQERNGGEEGRGGRGAGSDGETRDRSRSRSRDRNRRRKKGHGRDHSHSGSDREINSRNSKSRKGKKRDRSWSHSPVRKGSRKGRSRSRDRASHHASSSHHERDRKHGDSHKSYTEKYKKGDRIERDPYRR